MPQLLGKAETLFLNINRQCKYTSNRFTQVKFNCTHKENKIVELYQALIIL